MPLLLIIILLLLTSCGRKQRNIFSFPQEEQKKISVFDFPCVKGMNVTKTNQGNKIQWIALKEEGVSEKKFLGYNLYRLNTQGFIPKKPLNASPLKNNEFFDKQKLETQNLYLVKAVFMSNGKIIEGLSSQIKGLNPESESEMTRSVKANIHVKKHRT